MVDLAPLDFRANAEEHRRKIATTVNAALNGGNRTVGTVTLTNSATTTTVLSPYVTQKSHIAFTPVTADAAGEVGSMYVSARTNETSFVITHSNDSTTRTFTYVIFNP